MSRHVRSGLRGNVRGEGRTKKRSLTDRASSASAKTPTALGAAADVPPWFVAHSLFPLSVVT